MARKNLLQGLMAEAGPADPSEATSPRGPRYSKGAIGAVSQSIAALKSRSVVDLDPASIVEGGLPDRVEHDAAEHARLVESIRDHGQQVPVLVRPDPEDAERYRIVYGRRRVLALRDLGQTVKAMIRDLDDREAILAQGQENSARRDLSFIEKARFARQMAEAGYDRKVICDALTTDKTLISRLLQVAEAVPAEVVERIGAAPAIGRDRWLAVAAGLGGQKVTAEEAVAAIAVSGAESSDARFEALQAWLASRAAPSVAAPRPVPAQKRMLTGPEGERLGHVVRRGATLRIELASGPAGGFDDWLADNIEDLHRDWLARRG